MRSPLAALDSSQSVDWGHQVPRGLTVLVLSNNIYQLPWCFTSISSFELGAVFSILKFSFTWCSCLFYLFWGECEQGRGRERGRENLKQALRCQHRAQGGARTPQPQDHDLSRSWMLNRPSHPGAPPCFLDEETEVPGDKQLAQDCARPAAVPPPMLCGRRARGLDRRVAPGTGVPATFAANLCGRSC